MSDPENSSSDRWSFEEFTSFFTYDDLYYFGVYFMAYIHVAVIVYVTTVIFGLYPRKRDLGISSGSRILFVIAHPDDECMFFGPIIVTLTKTDPAKVHLLCLSSGNFRKDGPVRSAELTESCKRLGIPVSNVLLMNSSFFPDDPKMVWDRDRLARVILTHVETLDIDRIVTFDEDGVSGHKNHIALYDAVFSLISKRKLPAKCRAFALDSVNVFRKYTSICDSLLASLFDENLYIVSIPARNQIASAMAAHSSQLVWFRRLYLIFSRYLFLNGFTEIGDEFNFELT